MRVHLVGGYPGSGKSAAIAGAVKILSAKGIKVSVIKDDQVDFILDTNPVQKTGAPFARITGGCSCCNFTQLDSQIEKLKKKSDPSVIFTEYNGTCTGLIPGLLKPLREFRGSEIERADFSTFVDAEILLDRLQGKPLNLSAEYEYLLSRHIDEAEILVLSKSDLLSSEELMMLKSLAREKLTSKQIAILNSSDIDSINNWIDLISDSSAWNFEVTNRVDHTGNPVSGNTVLLDEELQIISEDDSAPDIAFSLMKKLSISLKQNKYPVEHFNFLLSFNKKTLKFTYSQILEERTIFPTEKSGLVDLMINARLHTSPDELRKMLSDKLEEIKANNMVEIKVKFISYLQK